MSPPGRPKGEFRSAQHEGAPVLPPGRPKGEFRSAQHEGAPVLPLDGAQGPEGWRRHVTARGEQVPGDRADDAAWSALAQHLAARAGALGATVLAAERLSGGAIQENWRLQMHFDGGALAGPCDLVMRTDAPSAMATSHGRAQEYALLSAAWQAGVKVPQPLWLCEDLAVTGRPFFIMRRVAGTAAGHLLVKDSSWRGDRVRLAESLGAQLARIHSLRPPHSGLGFLPQCDDEPPARHAVRTLRAHLDALPLPQPALEWGLDWLARHAPDAAEQVLCHGDYRTGNYLVDEHGLTGILDWEFACWGDAMQDIGWFCARCWRFGATQREAGGIGTREDFYRGYEQAGGRLRRDHVAYWEVMAHVRWAVIALQQAQRHLSGEQPSLLLALTGHIVPELAYEVLRMTAEAADAHPA